MARNRTVYARSSHFDPPSDFNQESQDEYAELELDFDLSDPALRAALGENIPEATQLSQHEKRVCEVWVLSNCAIKRRLNFI